MRKAIFLDRDGVLNPSVVSENGITVPPPDAAALVVFPDALEALPLMRQAGYLLICVTNQPDIARGTRDVENVEAMNAKVSQTLNLDALYYCPHDTKDGCSCRKPEPGMLREAAENFNIDLAASWMIGDRISDIQAGGRAGCRTVFLDRGLDKGVCDHAPDSGRADHVASNLVEASRYILLHQHNREESL